MVTLIEALPDVTKERLGGTLVISWGDCGVYVRHLRLAGVTVVYRLKFEKLI